MTQDSASHQETGIEGGFISSDDDDGAIVNDTCASDAIAVFQHNLVWGNERAEYAGMGDRTGRDGNLSADPLLDEELRPTVGSPAIDAGVDAGAWGVYEDLEGVERPQGAGWDIGAFEGG